MQDPGDTISVCFRVDCEGEVDVYVETLPATHLKGALYRLEATPCFAYGASLGDTLRCGADEDGSLVVTEITRKSGNRTLRVLLDDDQPLGSTEAERLMGEFQQSECACTPHSPGVLAVNIPARADLKQILAKLTAKEIRWDAGDPTYGELFPTQ